MSDLFISKVYLPDKKTFTFTIKNNKYNMHTLKKNRFN